MKDSIQEPTGEQCNTQAVVFQSNSKIGYAMWYPQMGGYSGKAVVILDREWTEDESGARTGGCFDVLVWHNGEFPFSGEGEDCRRPAFLHHCDSGQFVEFGETVSRLNSLGKKQKMQG